MSIENFKSEIANFARPTLYRVTIPGLLDQKLEFLCKAAQLPASNLGVIEIPYLGRKIKFAGDRTFEEWTITVQEDESFIIRKQLEDWSNMINDHVLNVGPNQASAYKQSGFVEQLGHDKGIIAKYEIRGMFPTNIAAAELSFESNDQALEYSVTLAYDYWTRLA